MRVTVFLSFETNNWIWLLRHYLNYLCEVNFIAQYNFNVSPYRDYGITINKKLSNFLHIWNSPT